MGRTYYLDLKTVIEILLGETGVLQRELTKEISPVREQCLCIIDVTKGVITRCLLVTRKGQQFDGYNLLPSLYALEDWEVTLTSISKTPTLPSHPAVSVSQQEETQPRKALPEETQPRKALQTSIREHLVPYQIVQVNMTQFADLSHKDRILVRSILLQINGERSVAEIRERLHLSRTIVDQILDSLAQQAIIRFRS